MNVYTQLNVTRNWGPTCRALIIDGLMWACTDDFDERDQMLVFVVNSLLAVGVGPENMYLYLWGWKEY